MILTAFTIFHVLLSLVGIGAGLVVLYGWLNSRSLGGWTSMFLSTTVATSVTGYFFPFHKITPGHIVGALSLIALAVAIYARRRFEAGHALRRTFLIASMVSLYLNVFVLVVQLFEKVPALAALAPTQSEPPFQIAQLLVLVAFIGLTVAAVRKFHGEALPTGRAAHA